MYRLLTAVLTLFVLLSSCKQKKHPIQKHLIAGKSYEVKIEVPAEWIDKVEHYSYKPTDTSLLMEFEKIIKPDTIANPHAQHVSKDYGKVFNPIFTDLDGEPGEELICLLGWDVRCPYLCVFKENEGIWYLIYLESIDTFYGAPSIWLAGNFSKNKTFYLNHVDNHGSGVYEENYSFYKLINNKVYHCLNLVSNSFGYGGGQRISHSVKTHFSFSSDQNDMVFVTYSYNFFPGINEGGKCSWCANEDIPLVNGESGISFSWDEKKKIYYCDTPTFKNTPDDLTPAKVESLEHAWNDTLFARAFNEEIQRKLKSGTPLQKRIISEYLKTVKIGSSPRK